jgi:hypothetical protein
MTVNPLILDPNGFNQMENYNIENMNDQIPCITINVSQSDICAWITSKGGWANIGTYDIMTLIRAYLHVPGSDLGFVVMSAYITGCVLYYIGNRPSGNSFTGCSFAT